MRLSGQRWRQTPDSLRLNDRRDGLAGRPGESPSHTRPQAAGIPAGSSVPVACGWGSSTLIPSRAPPASFRGDAGPQLRRTRAGRAALGWSAAPVSGCLFSPRPLVFRACGGVRCLLGAVRRPAGPPDQGRLSARPRRGTWGQHPAPVQVQSRSSRPRCSCACAPQGHAPTGTRPRTPSPAPPRALRTRQHPSVAPSLNFPLPGNLGFSHQDAPET